MYKLVVLDIDGTLLTDNEKITKENYEAIHSCIAKGVPVSICTGRNVHNTIRVLKDLQINTPYVCVDGLIVFDSVKKEYIKDSLIEKEYIKEILEEVDKEHLYVELCTKYNYIKYVKSKDLGEYNYGGMPKTPQEIKKDFEVKGAIYVDTLEDMKKGKYEINQFLFAGDKEIVNKVKNKIKDMKKNNIELKDDLWENYCFVAPKNSRKIDGVKALCKYYGITLDEVIAVGDEMNDFDMIEGVGLGVAMGNGCDKVKKVSKYVTKTNNDSGVAKVINKFILNNKE